MPETTSSSLRQWSVALVLMVVVAGAVWWMAQSKPVPQAVELTPPGEVDPDTARWVSTGERLHDIRLGSARSEVEAILGPPEAMNVDPVSMDNNTYCTRYFARLSQPLPLAPQVRDFCEARLTYDATKPGHPLVQIHCFPRRPPPPRIVTVSTSA